MITTLAVANYRSLLNLVVPLGQLTVVTGANGSGKSNLYRALRLLSQTASDGVVNALAREGGLASTFWAGPETLTRGMKRGAVPVQGGPRNKRARLRLGFAGEDFGYSVSLGLPQDGASRFHLDPQIKKELIWSGSHYRPASALVDRDGAMVRARDGRAWRVMAQHLAPFDSLFGHVADPQTAPEVLTLRQRIRGWRFYDHFRTDQSAAPRRPQLGTRTPVLHHDGRDLAAALQTIMETDGREVLDEAVADAFPGARVEIDVLADNRFAVQFFQHGLLRPLSGAELSDGTLRYLLWVAALLSPRPPPLMVLNEPETSLHPDLLPALARLIVKASNDSQVWVVSHASRLIAALEQHDVCTSLRLDKALGETTVPDLRSLDQPPWHWPDQEK
ncbi:MAG: AAA family ATPase [Gammaproteobacteria bacterium]